MNDLGQIIWFEVRGGEVGCLEDGGQGGGEIGLHEAGFVFSVHHQVFGIFEFQELLGTVDVGVNQIQDERKLCLTE